jgi:predicted kinase
MMVIVSGLPGSGKSYFASRLAQKTGAHYINSDLTRREMDARGQYTFEDRLTVYEEMARRAGDLMRQGNTVVVDATFYRQEMRNLFLTLARLLHHKVCFIEVVAPEELIRERLLQPRLDSEADFSVYELVRSQYEQLLDEHLTLESSNNNLEEMLQKGMEYIRKMNEGV